MIYGTSSVSSCWSCIALIEKLHGKCWSSPHTGVNRHLISFLTTETPSCYQRPSNSSTVIWNFIKSFRPTCMRRLHRLPPRRGTLDWCIASMPKMRTNGFWCSNTYGLNCRVTYWSNSLTGRTPREWWLGITRQMFRLSTTYLLWCSSSRRWCPCSSTFYLLEGLHMP